MSAKKARDKDMSSAPAARFGLPSGPARRLLLGLLLVGFLIGGTAVLWERVRGWVLRSPDYCLTVQQVETTPQPEWIRSDIRDEVFHHPMLDGPLSILDPELPYHIAQAFALHPWVAKVRGVRPHFPAGVTVDLEYRRPVCVVEQVLDGAVELRPVDAEGVVLPKNEFSATALGQYPRLADIHTSPVGSEGTRWGDARVLGAAQIAAALGEEWKRLGLEQIVATAAERGSPDAWNYELFTRRRTRILWGRGPEQPLANEFPAAEKVRRLKDYVRDHGSLDDLEQIDLRSEQSFRLVARPPR